MLENRSFDHMLGALEPVVAGLDGVPLQAGMANEYAGREFPVFKLEKTSSTKAQDPCHSGECVDRQVSGGNGGFAADYIETRANPATAEPVVVMGYFDGEQLPVYGDGARRFCVCDRWFCSLKGATFPNRLYAVAGRAAGSRDNASPPTYHLPSFVRKLDAAGASWRWYTHELFATIWAIDRDYLPKTFDNVRPFSSPFSHEDFFSAAKSGSLPDVAWIDPNFVDVGGAAGSNDDHPPSDVRAGQELVLRILNALVRSPVWERTLLIVTYDEHGGFFDHVEPPVGPVSAEEGAFNDGRLGFRTPCVIVGPRARRGHVSHFRFDPNSVINLIRWRFGLGALSARDEWSHNMAKALDFRSPPNPDAPDFGQASPGGLPANSRGASFGAPCFNYLTNQLPLPADAPVALREWRAHQDELRPLYEMSRAAGLI